MSFCIDDDKLSKKFKTIWSQIEDLQIGKFNALPAHNESFRIIFINSVLVYENKYYLEVYLDNCTSKIVGKEMTILMIIFLILLKIRFLILMVIDRIVESQ